MILSLDFFSTVAHRPACATGERRDRLAHSTRRDLLKQRISITKPAAAPRNERAIIAEIVSRDRAKLDLCDDVGDDQRGDGREVHLEFAAGDQHQQRDDRHCGAIAAAQSSPKIRSQPREVRWPPPLAVAAMLGSSKWLRQAAAGRNPYLSRSLILPFFQGVRAIPGDGNL